MSCDRSSTKLRKITCATSRPWAGKQIDGASRGVCPVRVEEDETRGLVSSLMATGAYGYIVTMEAGTGLVRWCLHPATRWAVRAGH